MNKIKNIYEYEDNLVNEGYKYIAGCDEAGRGPMAGPLVASSVVLPVGYRLEYLNDSKQVSPKRRDYLFDIIMHDAIEVQVEIISVEDVDRYNVYTGSQIAMTRCVQRLKNCDYVLTDCMPLDIKIPFLSIVKGDSKSASIAAASIIAKVTRDRLMLEYDKVYPEYEFYKHKGYVTKRHLELLEKYGVCPIHRRSFAPVQAIINKNNGV